MTTPSHTANPFHPQHFFDMAQTTDAALFDGLAHVWEAVPAIAPYIRARFAAGLPDQRADLPARYPGAHFGANGPIFVAADVVIEPGVYVEGPAIIAAGCVLRHGAYVRADALLGSRALVGHTTEIKNAALLDGASAPHFSYIGDSVLGRSVNLGAGVKLSNFPLTAAFTPTLGTPQPTIRFEYDGVIYDTELVKLGAIIGDGCQIGCNTVTHPGCIIGRDTLVYPQVSLPKGFTPHRRIVKLKHALTVVERR